MKNDFEKTELSFDYGKLEDRINLFIKKYSYIECVYFIDSLGRQISKTFFDKNTPVHTNIELFAPATIGDDHSLKQYFYELIVSKNDSYISNDYLSLTSGNRCKTVSIYVNQNVILALDITVPK